MKKTICFIPSIESLKISDQQIMKDVCVIPSLYAESYDWNCIIGAYEINTEKLKNTFPKTKFININVNNDYIKDTETFLKNNNIDVLFLFGPYPSYLPLVKLYKSINKNGKVYLKCDMNKWWINRLCNTANFYELLNLCDVITSESEETRYLMNKKLTIPIDALTNGYFVNDQNLINYDEKENIILNVARLGTYQKQTDVLIEAFLKSEIDNWKLRLVGSAEDGFINNITNKYKQYKLFNNIEFVGEIKNRKLMFEEYKKAKVFMLTSNMEGFSHVLVEAAAKGCFILSTNVDSARDVTDNEKYGIINEVGDIEGLANSLKDIVNNEYLLSDICKRTQINAINEYNWQYLIQKLNLIFKLRGVV